MSVTPLRHCPEVPQAALHTLLQVSGLIGSPLHCFKAAFGWGFLAVEKGHQFSLAWVSGTSNKGFCCWTAMMDGEKFWRHNLVLVQWQLSSIFVLLVAFHIDHTWSDQGLTKASSWMRSHIDLLTNCVLTGLLGGIHCTIAHYSPRFDRFGWLGLWLFSSWAICSWRVRIFSSGPIICRHLTYGFVIHEYSPEDLAEILDI